MSIVVRILKKDEAALANDFFNAIYKTNRSLQHFEWEFVNGPFGPAIYVIAIDTAVSEQVKVVGIQCAIPIALVNANGDRQLSAKSEDTLVDPSYRGQKIFEKMYDLLFEECKRAGIKYIWGFTPAKKAFERIDFEIPFHAHQALMVFNPLKAYQYLASLNDKNRVVDRFKIAGLAMLSWISSTKLRAGQQNSLNIRRVSLDSRDTLLSSLTPHSGYYFLDMTTAYLSWRLAENPFDNNYEVHQVYAENRLVADVIINYRQPNPGYIEQIIFEDDLSSSVKQQIIVAIVSQMRSKVDLIRVLCFDTNRELADQEALYERCGFIVLKRGAHFVWKSLADDEVKPKDLFLSRLFTQGNQ